MAHSYNDAVQLNNNGCQKRRHRIDKYLDILLANQTARKAMPPTIAKSRNRKMAGCLSYYY